MQDPSAAPRTDSAEQETDTPVVHLLVVDDNEEILIALQTYFEAQGYVVTLASDGRTALRLIEERGERFDLILLDVVLPEMNGFEVLEETQRIGLAAPVLMMSGRGNQEDILRGFGLGAQDYIVKP